MKIRNLFSRSRTPAILWGLLILVAACTDESEVTPVDKGQYETLVNFRFAGRGSSVDADKDISTLRIIAFDSRNGGLVFNKALNFTANPVKVEMLSGKRDFYVIANEPSGMTGVLDNILTYNDLRSVRIPAVSLYDGGAFVAFGSKAAQTIVPKANNNEVTIDDMKRLATKIDLTLRGKNFSEPTTVTFSNLPDAVPLFEDIAYDPSAVGTVRVTTFTDATLESGYIWAKTVDGIVVPSYKPTSMVADNAVKINVTLENNQTVSGKIGHKVSDSNYALQRNTIYGLIANVDADRLSIITSIANWEPTNQDYPAGGGSFWMAEPQSVRVGLDGTEADKTAVFSAKMSTNAELSYKWYRRRQLTDMSYVTEELTSGVNGVTISLQADKSSKLTIVTSKLDDSGEIYCVGVTTSPDGRVETLESGRATLMVVGTEIDDAGIYPDMQNWTPPRNALFGATCLLRDHREDDPKDPNDPENNKVYRVKLMADGNWWMIQDLAYGHTSTEDEFDDKCQDKAPTNLIKNGAYGVCMKAIPGTFGGYLYNSYAAVQLEVNEDMYNLSTLLEYLPSLCPEGWHYPGHVDGEINKEWVSFVEKTGIALKSKDILEFEYNNPASFNAYNLELATSFASYHGGYAAMRGGRPGNYGYTLYSLGIISSPGYGEIMMDTNNANTPEFKVPIRCIRNFKN